MPTTRTNTTRRASTSPSRFSRPGTSAPTRTGAGRFSRPLATQKKPAKGKKQQDGIVGLATTALSAVGGAQAKAKGKGRLPSRAGQKSGPGKAKPAMALLAAAGAVLGREQLQKRKQGDVVAPASSPEATPVQPAPTATTPPVTP